MRLTVKELKDPPENATIRALHVKHYFPTDLHGRMLVETEDKESHIIREAARPTEAMAGHWEVRLPYREREELGVEPGDTVHLSPVGAENTECKVSVRPDGVEKVSSLSLTIKNQTDLDENPEEFYNHVLRKPMMGRHLVEGTTYLITRNPAQSERCEECHMGKIWVYVDDITPSPSAVLESTSFVSDVDNLQFREDFWDYRAEKEDEE